MGSGGAAPRRAIVGLRRKARQAVRRRGGGRGLRGELKAPGGVEGEPPGAGRDFGDPRLARRRRARMGGDADGEAMHARGAPHAEFNAGSAVGREPLGAKNVALAAAVDFELDHDRRARALCRLRRAPVPGTRIVRGIGQPPNPQSPYARPVKPNSASIGAGLRNGASLTPGSTASSSATVTSKPVTSPPPPTRRRPSPPRKYRSGVPVAGGRSPRPG